MKVRIVKCTNGQWYSNQIGSVICVNEGHSEHTPTDYYMLDCNYLSAMPIKKEDCEIIEVDEPKPEPFDMERALKGEPFLLKRGGNHLWYLIGKSKFGYQSEHGVKYYIEVNLPHHGTPTINTATKEHLNREYEMAPREPEYQTVWVNLYANGCSAHEETYERALEQTKCTGFSGLIGTFPITLKKTIT